MNGETTKCALNYDAYDYDVSHKSELKTKVHHEKVQERLRPVKSVKARSKDKD